jgi:septal ring factor EnvC (AmiA/AmiB activator)
VKFILIFFSIKIYISSLCILSVDASGNFNAIEINKLLNQEKKELNKLNAEIKKQKSSLKKMGLKQFSILKKQGILDDQLKAKSRELKIYNWNLNINKNKIKNLNYALKRNRIKANLQETSVANRLRMIYKNGNMFPVKLLFSADDFTDILRRIKYLEKIATYDTAMFLKYDKQINILSSQKEDLLNAKNKILLFESKAKKTKAEIIKERFNKSQFLARLNKKKQNNKQLKDELVKSSNKLNQLISRLEGKIIEGEGLDIFDKKGRLLPPVKGRFLNVFGRVKDKKYKTHIVYNGVNIFSKKGTPVRNVFNGKVLYTGKLEGYGNIVIIGHGKDYHSLYGHMDDIITKVGKIVLPGQIIGRSGDTGSIIGESLYFEIRYKGLPVEPTAWLIK